MPETTETTEAATPPKPTTEIPVSATSPKRTKAEQECEMRLAADLYIHVFCRAGYEAGHTAWEAIDAARVFMDTYRNTHR